MPAARVNLPRRGRHRESQKLHPADGDGLGEVRGLRDLLCPLAGEADDGDGLGEVRGLRDLLCPLPGEAGGDVLYPALLPVTALDGSLTS